nr:immunoglobulin light chain junction region [Macaca mulatta]MOW02966.1 immunoglobulin light chain junction region [Macaca mulatta]MOW03261.1 immunoglobulin light chain junction region [Macaca mulatta]MOW03402.1 immunoglobulin light chain junction region [Macaca mulatta]MOW03962.1 immunoglobulin light chain junction region [Macaca mulatta]
EYYCCLYYSGTYVLF